MCAFTNAYLSISPPNPLLPHSYSRSIGMYAFHKKLYLTQDHYCKYKKAYFISHKVAKCILFCETSKLQAFQSLICHKSKKKNKSMDDAISNRNQTQSLATDFRKHTGFFFLEELNRASKSKQKKKGSS